MRSGKEQPASDQLQGGRSSAPDTGRLQANREEEQPLTGPSECRAATRSSTRQAKEAEEQQLAAAKHGRTRNARSMGGNKQPVLNPAAAHAPKGSRIRDAAAKEEEQQLQQQGQASPGRVPKRRRHNPMQPEAPPSASPEEDPQEGPLALLPGDVLDHVMSLLAAKRGGSRIRSTCSWLRSAFDRCNTRLVLREPDGQLPRTFPARLLDIVRRSPCMSNLTLTGGMKRVSWSQIHKAGGPQLLQRLERLTLMEFPPVRDLKALAACTRLQHLCLHGRERKPTLPLQALAACGGTLRHLDIQDCGSVRDFTPLAACAALRYLSLGHCRKLGDLAPLAACVRLQQLRLSHNDQLRDLSPLTACVQLRTLHLAWCWVLMDLRPLASCAALRGLDLCGCSRLSDLTPLAACTALQRLDLSCSKVEDVAPLAACVALRWLDLRSCSLPVDLAPLASCVSLQILQR